MRNSLVDGKHYRLRAEECRTIAEGYLDDDARTVMLKVASDCERMAECVDQLDSDIAELAKFSSAIQHGAAGLDSHGQCCPGERVMSAHTPRAAE